MKLIAHRGLIYGPNGQLENNPSQIESVLKQGFDVEVDVWYQQGQWFLGHDRPTYMVDFDFLKQPGLWIHAKNLDALYALGSTILNYFWHQKDDFTLTSEGFIWTYPNMPLTAHSICVMPEWEDIEFKNLPEYCYGICSDYVSNPNFQRLITRS